MEQHFHMAVWVDHHEARIFSFNQDRFDKAVVRPADPIRHIHHKANEIGSGHALEDQAFYESIAKAIKAAGAILISGPANARTELMKHLEAKEPNLAKNIFAVERVDHPSDSEVVAHAREYFASHDRMKPQI